MNNIIEGKMSKNNLDQITASIVNSNEFPWFFLKKPVSEKYPCFSHVMVPRYDYKKNEGYKVNSGFFNFFEKIFRDFCKKNKIKVNRILRASLNLQTYLTIPANKHIYIYSTGSTISVSANILDSVSIVD